MGTRTRQRVKMVLPIRIWGMDSKDKPFTLLAHTLDITRNGARLGGVRTRLKLGEIIGVQYRTNKARYRIMWLGRPGKPDYDQVGLQQVEPIKEIWNLELPDSKAHEDETQAAKRTRTAKENREHPRYPWNAGVGVAAEHSESAYWAELNDISENGCYVHTASPMAVGSGVRLTIKGGEIVIEAAGLVRTSDPVLGMGVEFTGFDSPDDREALENLIARLSGGDKVDASQVRPSVQVVERIRKAASELEELQNFIKKSEIDVLQMHVYLETVQRLHGISLAMVQWLQLQGDNQDPYAAIQALNAERMHLATNLCRSLNQDMHALKLSFPADDTAKLLRAVEDLFAHLAGLDIALEEGASGR